MAPASLALFRVPHGAVSLSAFTAHDLLADAGAGRRHGRRPQWPVLPTSAGFRRRSLEDRINAGKEQTSGELGAGRRLGACRLQLVFFFFFGETRSICAPTPLRKRETPTSRNSLWRSRRRRRQARPATNDDMELQISAAADVEAVVTDVDFAAARTRVKLHHFRTFSVGKGEPRPPARCQPIASLVSRREEADSPGAVHGLVAH